MTYPNEGGINRQGAKGDRNHAVGADTRCLGRHQKQEQKKTRGKKKSDDRIASNLDKDQS